LPRTVHDDYLACHNSFDVNFKEAIPASQLHHLHALQDQVIYPSSFTSTSWDSQTLSMDELGVAFGFPLWLCQGLLLVSSFPVIPIQILHGFTTNNGQTNAQAITLAAPAIVSHQTWHPSSLQKFLLHMRGLTPLSSLPRL
jgi:hypothetical protein